MSSIARRATSNWLPFSIEQVAQLREEGRPVFIDFTAAWCVTCQVNKANAYPAKVRKLFKEHNILALKADNTNYLPEIDAAIKELGRGAVPVNVLYVPDDDEPHLTKELFGAGYMIDFLNEHLGEAYIKEILIR